MATVRTAPGNIDVGLPESPVRCYYDDDPRVSRALVSRLNREISERACQVARGLADDWGNYKERCGFIQGLEWAKEIAEETEKKMRE